MNDGKRFHPSCSTISSAASRNRERRASVSPRRRWSTGRTAGRVTSADFANEVRRLVALAGLARCSCQSTCHTTSSRGRTVTAGERTLSPTEVVVRTNQPLPAAMEHLERTMVQQALKESSGRLEDAAQRLGLSRKGLYLKRLRLGITDLPWGGTGYQ